MTLFRAREIARERRDFYGSPTRNPMENPVVPLSSVGLDNVFATNVSDAGEPVTVDRAMGLPALFRCVGLLATVVAGCPLRAYKLEGRKDVTGNVGVIDPTNPATTYTPFELWELVVAHLALWGNAYVNKVRNGGGQIIDLKPINPACVKVKLDPTTKQKVFEIRIPDERGNVSEKPNQVLTTFEVMHIPGLGYDGLQGLSPISMAAQTFGTALAADKLAARFYGNGTHLSGIISVKAPLADQAQADEIRARWISRSGGLSNSSEVAVLDAETSFQPLTIPPDDLQFLQSRQWQEGEIALMYGIPPHLVGDTQKSTSWGTGIEQQNIGFVSYTISGWTNRIEQRVTREVVPTRGQYAEFDLDRLMRGSASERFIAYANAIQWGWLTRNEARIKENMEPIDGLDEPLTPLNMKAGNTQTEAVDPNAAPLGPATEPGSGQQQAIDEGNEA